mgnify:CR=1 FL=1
MCVRSKHQNPKLMLDALGGTCSFDLSTLKWFMTPQTMVHVAYRGEKCLGKANLDSFLIRKLSNADAIEFSQWVSLDRAELVIHVLPREEFIDNLLMTEQHIM